MNNGAERSEIVKCRRNSRLKIGNTPSKQRTGKENTRIRLNTIIGSRIKKKKRRKE